MTGGDGLLPIRRNPGRIAVFRALFLGDLLMSVPALRALRRRFPDAEVTLIGLPWARGFIPHVQRYVDRLVEFPGYPGLPEVDPAPERTERFLREQRAYGYDLALQMHGDGNITNGILAELGAGATLGYARPGDNRLTLGLPHDRGGSEIHRWLGLVAALGAPADDTGIEFATSREDRARADALLSGGPLSPESSVVRPRAAPLVALHAGAKEAIRQWPPERFAALADRLAEEFGARVALTGTAGEREITAAVGRAMRHRALDLTGRTDLGVFAGLLARLDLLVTNDTGASHLAAATGTPSVVLFGPTRPEQFAPLDRERHRVVDALRWAGEGLDGAAALRALPVAPVLAECARALRAGGYARLRDATPASVDTGTS